MSLQLEKGWGHEVRTPLNGTAPQDSSNQWGQLSLMSEKSYCSDEGCLDVITEAAAA